jgi:hypothetical protein
MISVLDAPILTHASPLRVVVSRGFDWIAASIDARLGRNGGWRHHHLLATSDTARAGPHDLASRVARHNAAAAFWTGVSSDCRSEVILRTDMGTRHVMKHRKNLQPFGAASRAHRLIRFNLHLVALHAMSAASCSVKPEDTDQHVGDAGGKLAIVHANVDRRVQRRRRVTRVETDARDLRRTTVTR